MSDGTPPSSGRWSRQKLAIVLFPFVWAAVAVNLFLATLLGTWFGWTAVSPTACVLFALPLSVPATWAAALWVDHLLDEAER